MVRVRIYILQLAILYVEAVDVSGKLTESSQPSSQPTMSFAGVI